MKQTIVPNNNEIRLADDDLIVSKTDVKGRITYANRTFMRIAGFAEPELLGMPHNIIRHPDMPRGVFKLLWDTLQGGNEFFGYVKNLCKDGSFYWVMANVTPDFDPSGQLRGYYSVRRRASEQGIATMAAIYRRMIELERQASGRESMSLSQGYLNELLQSQGCDYTAFVLDVIKKDGRS